jgi:septum formation protein
MAVRLAEAKAGHVAAQRPGAAVLGADTIVVLEGTMLGKPSGPEEATGMLRRLGGRRHSVITGVAVRTAAGAASGCRRSEISFGPMSEQRIRAYVATGSPLDKAGSYGIQDPMIMEIASVHGCRLNVVGLPLCLVAELLERAGAPIGVPAGIDCPGCAPVEGGERS